MILQIGCGEPGAQVSNMPSAEFAKKLQEWAPKKQFDFTVRANDMNFNPAEIPPKVLCGGLANQTDVNIHLIVVDTSPQFDDDLHTCKLQV